jgi:hypothetical protein
MKPWHLEWHPMVRHDVMAMHRRSAKEMCTAIQALAETGRGRVEVLGDGRFALRIDGAVGFFDADATGRRLRVMRVLPTW